MNIIENNKLIAKFMGLKPKMEFPDVYTFSDKPFFSVREDNPEKVMDSISKYAKYHSDWNWLMEVVGKITSTKEFYTDYPNNNIFWEAYNQIDKQEIYNACVEFIKWHNENK